jgi:hypothetical protein
MLAVRARTAPKDLDGGLGGAQVEPLPALCSHPASRRKALETLSRSDLRAGLRSGHRVCEVARARRR